MNEDSIALQEVLSIYPEDFRPDIIDIWKKIKGIEKNSDFKTNLDKYDQECIYEAITNEKYRHRLLEIRKNAENNSIAYTQFFEENEIIDRLDDDQEPFIVFWLKESEITVQEFAKLLDLWHQKSPSVKRILGIEQMRQGNLPLTFAGFFVIPIIFGNTPENWVQHVGLVTVKKGLEPSALQHIFDGFINNFGHLAYIENYHQYCYMSR